MYKRQDYARAKHAEQVLTQQIAQGEIEEAYLGGVLEELARAENERDLSEIRAELEAGGYVRPADRRKQGKQQPSKPMHFRSSGHTSPRSSLCMAPVGHTRVQAGSPQWLHARDRW